MATALELAQAHRRSQAALLRATEQRLLLQWARTMSGRGDLRSLAEQWIALMVPYILVMRARSEALTRLHVVAARDLLLPGAEPLPDDIDADELPEEALVASLTATAIAGTLERIGLGQTAEEALEHGGIEAAGAGVRHALNGGRSFSANAIARDSLALGWYRVTKQGCCSFCAVLASRGAVYKEDSFDNSDPRFQGEGREKVHDHCACTMEPIYRRDQPIADLNRSFADLWGSLAADEDDVAKGRAGRVGDRFSGNAALNAFRRRYERLYPDARG